MSYLPVVIKAEYIDDYKIKLEFSNGLKKIVDCKGYLKGEIFKPLKDKKYFKKFFVDGWTIAWSNGADIAPETLFEA